MSNRAALTALVFAGLSAPAALAQTTCNPTNITLQSATSSYTQTCGTFLPRYANDGATTTSWAIGRCSGGGDTSLPESLVFETASDLTASTTPIKITLKIMSGGLFPGNPSSVLSLGHFAISYTSAARDTFADGNAASTALGSSWTRLTPTLVSARWCDANGSPLPPNNQDPVLTVRPDGSILASGPDPEYALYTVEMVVSNVTITGLRLDLIDENGASTATVNGLPTGGPGRHGTGNCFIRELAFGYNRVPTITAQPQSGALCGTNTLTLSVGVDGEGPFGYQWRKNGSNIPSATGSTFIVQAGQAGSYDVVITAPCSTLTSTPAVITNNAPTLESQPESGNLCTNGSHTMFVVARGQSPFSYQWKKDGVDIAGATSSAFTATARSGAGAYTVRVTSACGEIVSNTANVSGNNPTITTQPAGGDLCATGSVLLTVAAGGNGPFNYQWKKDGVDIAGATNPNLTVTQAQGPASYSALVLTSCGSTLSQAAVVTGGAAPGITTQPAGGSLCASGGSLTVSVVASGDNLTYQWRKDGGNISGATSSSFTIGSGGMGSYDVVVTGTCGTITSNAAVVTGPLCAADYNCDAFVDFFDYEDFVTGFEAGVMNADCNGDQFIDFFDYECFVELFMQGC